MVNGDCYWLVAEKPGAEDLLWLAAAVGNSTFIEAFYDHRFPNKLYAGRRRFVTQYVEQFPLPDPRSAVTREIIAKARTIYATASTPAAQRLTRLRLRPTRCTALRSGVGVDRQRAPVVGQRDAVQSPPFMSPSSG